MRNLTGGAVNQQGYERLRRENLRHESAIAAFGWFFLLGGVLGLIGFFLSLVMLLLVYFAGTVDIVWAAQLGLLSAQLILGVVQVTTGQNLLKLKPWSRIAATILSIGFIVYGIGVWFMILAWSEKGKFIFSEQYRTAFEATPYIKRHMTATAWILIFVPLVATALVFVLMVFVFGVAIWTSSP